MKKTMKIVVAPDSFKGSVSAPRAAAAIESGLLQSAKESVCVKCIPIADGGEGTLDALVPPSNRIEVTVRNPLGTPIRAQYGIRDDTAVIEMAACAGLTLIAEEKRRAGRTTTYGVGQMISDALARGYRKIVLTVGGSATNDGGAGMLAALGAVFSDENGTPFVPTGETLQKIAAIDTTGLPRAFYECDFSIATDVTNPLVGPQGATAVYGPQKGGTEADLAAVERGMIHYADLLERVADRRVRDVPGTGAGGGIAAPLLAFGRVTVKKGIELVLDVTCFDQSLADADYVITGEGRLDNQSFFGKTVSGVVRHANAYGVPVVCLVGCCAQDVQRQLPPAVSTVRTVRSLAASDEDAMRNAETYLRTLAKQWMDSVTAKENAR